MCSATRLNPTASAPLWLHKPGCAAPLKPDDGHPPRIASQHPAHSSPARPGTAHPTQPPRQPAPSPHPHAREAPQPLSITAKPRANV